jgi:tRNA pseudouridine55 synthase
MNGVINIYKPKGMTSHDVVSKIRKISGIKKVGHTGTLDPDAKGVLPICIGKATKLADMLTFSDKRYTALLRLGVVTDTQDLTGNVLFEREVSVTKEEFLNATKKFVGEIEQIPPMYSAVKIGGKKLYELARKGIEVERKPRKITIYGINVLSFDGKDAKLDISCSKGTYIRTLCHDIGDLLGCGGCMAELVRTQSSIFKAEDAVSIDELTSENIEGFLIPPDVLFDFEKIVVTGEVERKICNGNAAFVPGISEGKYYRVYGGNGNFLCISKGLSGKLTLVKSFF